MKLSNVIAELENGSRMIYEAIYEDGTRVTMKNSLGYPDFNKYNHEGVAYDQQSRAGYFSGNCRLNGDWQPVKEEVTWQEAIQAWAEGKTVFVVNEAGGRVFRRGGLGASMCLLQEEIVHGIWFVEAQNETTEN